MNEQETKRAIEAALKKFANRPPSEAALSLFEALGYTSPKKLKLSPNNLDNFKATLDQHKRFKDKNALPGQWKSIDFLFQLTDDEIRAAGSHQIPFKSQGVYNGAVINSYLFFALELKGSHYTRTQLAGITREINRPFDMPALVLFRHGETLTLAIIPRRLHKREEGKDVLEKVTLIRDIGCDHTHRAHIEILYDLSFDALYRKHGFSNFVELQAAWQKTLDTSTLNKRFYQELANWYFWALDQVSFPDDIEKDKDIRNATSLIRLITRITFIWFIKEKDLVPERLFDRRELGRILKNFSGSNRSHSYYQAILQNLFFGTLNQKMTERGFAREGSFDANRQNYGVKTLFRYADQFAVSEKEALALFADIPFLNGGLFDCLDKENDDGKVLYADGFSRNPAKRAIVPDFLFFGPEVDYDLNQIYGTKNKKYKVKGLFEILSSYKFTITENTPIEEEIALDPELLGKVFENLLAAYNPETGATARKQTGSFYTPREIVNYMVDESLKAYLKQKLEAEAGMTPEDAEIGLEYLIGYNEKEHLFDQMQTEVLINAIDACKVLDPACGSGAFPMGVLHKMVHILHKLDPGNQQWKAKQIARMDDPIMREQAEEVFRENYEDYGRKLYLIENCIYGVDIQPIAIQISKLRFFISLIVDQKVNTARENRGIRSLPNLETKFVAANTLIGLEKPKLGSESSKPTTSARKSLKVTKKAKAATYKLKNPEIEKLETELKELRHQHFSARTREGKLDCQKKDKYLRKQISALLVQDGWGSASAEQVADFDPYDQNVGSPFFDPEWMFGISSPAIPPLAGGQEGGFDVVIGNPPYLRVQGIQQTQPEYMPYYREHYQSAQGSFDLYALFIERGYQLLNSGGQFTYIVPHKFFQATFGGALRRLLTGHGALRQIVRFGSSQVFDESTTYTCLLFLSAQHSNGFDLLEVKTLERGEEVLQAARARTPHPDYSYQHCTEPTLSKDSKTVDWDFSIGEDKRILRRMQQHPNTLGNLVRKIFQGLATSADKIYVLETVDDKGDLVRCYSKHLEVEVEIERGLIKPFLMGKDVHRYECVKARNVVIFPYVVQNGKAELMSQNYIKRNFPLGWKYLKRNEYDLGERERGRMHGDDFYAYIYPKNLIEFETPKIMTPDICVKPEMTIDLSGELYHTTTLYSFAFRPDPLKSPKFYLGLLNSKVMWYFLSVTGTPLRGGYLRFKTEYLKPFPIAESTPEQERAIEILVGYVLHLKAQAEPGDMKAAAEWRVMTAYFEQLIDALVYEMYFPEELADADKRPSRLLTQAQLPALNELRGDKASGLRELYKKLYATDHPLREMLFFLDSLETVRAIEAKSKVQ